ncbi:MAG: prepilin-type N-terminal cleavage/methylation domain-containing protein, partial [Nitrososphaeria archaeon]
MKFFDFLYNNIAGGENVKKGFTLIELMIVIAIIIILAAIAIPNYARMQDRAKISAVQSDMKSISTALEAYFTDWGQYPTGDYSNLKAELTANGATLNGSGNKTLTGETG